MAETTTPITAEQKRSPIFGRTSVFVTMEEANKEHAERQKILEGLGRDNLYRVYEVPVVGQKDEKRYAVELNPQNAIASVCTALGWVANALTGGRGSKLTPTVVTAQAKAQGWTPEQIEETIKSLKKLQKANG